MGTRSDVSDAAAGGLGVGGAELRGESRMALVADDDSTLRLLTRTALEQDGWTVGEAADGVELCAAVARERPDVILLDVDMPRQDGFDACAELRATPAGEHIPVLMITAMNDQESISRAYEAGATDFLAKPINLLILRERLAHMLRASRAARELQNQRDFVEAVIDTAAALVLILDRDGRITRFNTACERATGFAASEVIGLCPWDVFLAGQAADRERQVFDHLVTDRHTLRYEGSWTTRDKGSCEIAWSNSVLTDSDGAVEYIVCTGLDITERNQAEQKIRFLASYDPLTGLPNRTLMTERLGEALGETRATELAVLFLDIDRFKNITGTFGHSVADELLKGVAERLRRSLRLSDVLARHGGLQTELGRLGGDEFTVLLKGTSAASEVAGIVERLRTALARPFRLKGQECTVTATVGISLYPQDGTDTETLIMNAEAAMYAARKTRRDSYRFYSASMESDVSDHLSLENELRQAVDRGELVLHYQPKADTRTRAIVGAEALVRWQHPTRGLVAPATFIPVAEDSGLIMPIGEWVLRAACEQVMTWVDSGLKPPAVAVNLSTMQFRQERLLERVGAILNETSMDPRKLAIEITESVIMRDASVAHTVLAKLRELGIQISIDDFGTGYSSLSALRDIPVHCLKIDQVFVKNMVERNEDLAITKAIIAMAHGLGLVVTAEGVETEEQLDLLRQEECDEVQGFLISPPVPAAEFTKLLQERQGSSP